MQFPYMYTYQSIGGEITTTTTTTMIETKSHNSRFFRRMNIFVNMTLTFAVIDDKSINKLKPEKIPKMVTKYIRAKLKKEKKTMQTMNASNRIAANEQRRAKRCRPKHDETNDEEKAREVKNLIFLRTFNKII